MNPFTGLSNGAAQPIGAWTQQQPNPELINPAMTPRHYLLQHLAQYHYLVARQLAQLAAQQSFQSSVNPYAGEFQGAGQFIPGQLGAIFVPDITMHCPALDDARKDDARDRERKVIPQPR